MDGGWGQVPQGCSAQSGGDWAAHFKSGPFQREGCVNNIYQLVCTGPEASVRYDEEDRQNKKSRNNKKSTKHEAIETDAPVVPATKELPGISSETETEQHRHRLCWKTCHSNADGIESRLATNNLGGAGPNSNDDERMVYTKVAHVEHKALDLHVTVNPRSRELFGAYNPWNASVNGQHKCFGVVNVHNEESVMLDFAFHVHGTDQIYIPPMPVGFTVFDVDHSGDAGQLEAVLFNTKPTPGKSVIGADLKQDESSHDLRVVSNTIGVGADNPLDANGEWAPLPEEASRARAVEVTYHDEATWTVTFSAKGGNHGRNFLFFGCEDEAQHSNMVAVPAHEKAIAAKTK